MSLHDINIKPSVDKRVIQTLASFIIAAIGFTITQDFIETNFNRSAFYFSESFLFSSFWWLFVPLLYTQWLLIKRSASIDFGIEVSVSFCLMAVHLFTYPLCVLLMSNLFFYHTFEYSQTLLYTLSEYLFTLIGVYAVLPIANLILEEKIKSPELAKNRLSVNTEPPVETSLLVNEGNTVIQIKAEEISHFTANTPYVNIQVGHKKYLHNETLKSIMTKLDQNQFVRIHKSTIVNIQHIQSYTSRLNGDYDILMADGATLRVSRNYAASFKKKFQASHHLRVK